MSDPRIRVCDADRHRVVAELERHVGAGRLTLDEFSERARLAYAASTLDDLAALTRDLPEPPHARPSHNRPRRVPSVLVVMAAVLAFLLGGAALATGTMPATASPMTGMSCH